MNVSPRYEEIVGEHRDEALGNFVGLLCGLPIFDGGREAVVHPSTGETVGYCSGVQIGCDDRTGSSIRYKKTTERFLEDSDRFLRGGRQQSVFSDVGLAGLRSAALAGATGGLLEWFDYSPEISLTGAAVVVAIGGLRFANSRRRSEKEFKSYIKKFSDYLSDMEKTTIYVNLLAPDSLVDSDAQTGSVDNKQSSNVYFIGEVPVDQQQRFDSFWDQADEILEEYGFTEWQGYRTVGVPELIRRMLEDVHNNSDFYDDDKEKVGSVIKRFGRCRSAAIKDIEELQARFKSKKSCEEHGIKGGAHALSNRSVTRRIKQADRRCMEAFRDLVASIEDITFKVKKRSTHDLLVSIYGGKSWYQECFWDELSRVLTMNGIDPYDEAVAKPAQFIVDLPDMMSTYNKGLPHRYVVRRLYKDFYKLYSERYAGMLSPKEFIDVDQHSEYGILSRLRWFMLSKQ